MTLIAGEAPEVPVDPEAERGQVDEVDAVTKIQAAHRGKEARKQVAYKKPAKRVTNDTTPAVAVQKPVPTSRVEDNATASREPAPRAAAADGDAAHMHGEEIPYSARAYIPTQEETVDDESRVSRSDGMVSMQRSGKRGGRKGGWDTATLEEAQLTKSELVKRNVELAIEDRRQKLLAKQAMKEERFRITRNREMNEIAMRKQEANLRRTEKLRKVQANEEEMERRKEYMYQKMASEARLKHERDAIRRAKYIESRERQHQEEESTPASKPSYLDPHLRVASAVPGPGAYAKADSTVSGGRFGTGQPKTSLEWTIYRAKQIPGPAEYSPAGRGKRPGFRFGKTKAKSSLDWTIHRAKQLPGPGEYSPRKPQKGGSAPRFSANVGKSTLDWVEQRARQLPGPAEYNPEYGTKDGGIRFSDARPKSDLEWEIHRAKDLPGPGEYGAPMQARKQGFRFGSSNAKTDVEWQIYYAKRRPGPASYYPTQPYKERMALEREAREVARQDADAERVKVTEQRELRAARLVKVTATAQDGGSGMANFVPAVSNYS